MSEIRPMCRMMGRPPPERLSAEEIADVVLDLTKEYRAGMERGGEPGNLAPAYEYVTFVNYFYNGRERRMAVDMLTKHINRRLEAKGLKDTVTADEMEAALEWYAGPIQAVLGR